jgi:hypothetical protein
VSARAPRSRGGCSKRDDDPPAVTPCSPKSAASPLGRAFLLFRTSCEPNPRHCASLMHDPRSPSSILPRLHHLLPHLNRASSALPHRSHLRRSSNHRITGSPDHRITGSPDHARPDRTDFRSRIPIAAAFPHPPEPAQHPHVDPASWAELPMPHLVRWITMSRRKGEVAPPEQRDIYHRSEGGFDDLISDAGSDARKYGGVRHGGRLL